MALYFLYLFTLYFLADSVQITLRGVLHGAVESRKRDAGTNVAGKPDQGYFCEILLGTPPQKMNVVIDTGSSNFAVAASSAAGVTPTFNASESATYQDTAHEESIKTTYYNGSWEGFFARDQLKMCTSCNSSTVDVVMITSSTGFFVSPDLWQGILGLGYQSLMQPVPDAAVAVLDTLYSNHVITHDVFTLTLCGRTNQDSTELHGSLEFSSTDSGYTTTDVVKEWYYQIEVTDITVNTVSIGVPCSQLNDPAAFVDSGTTNLILPALPYFTVLAAIESFAANSQRIDNVTLRNFLTRENSLCVAANQTDVFDWFPDLHVFIAANASHHFSIKMPPQQYIRQTMASIGEQKKFGVKTYCYTLAIEQGNTGTILGSSFMERLTVLHDRSNRQIGFKVDTTICNVVDPVFFKNISDITQRNKPGECLTGPAVKRPLIALLVTACVFVAAMIAIVSMLYRKKVRECCGRQPINRYSYMMNSDDDDSSIQIKNDEEEILHSSWETCDVGDL